MDLHYSQTMVSQTSRLRLFHYLMDLHYSQTVCPFFVLTWQFHYLMDLHYSQTVVQIIDQPAGFTTLWIYTILKPY